MNHNPQYTRIRMYTFLTLLLINVASIVSDRLKKTSTFYKINEANLSVEHLYPKVDVKKNKNSLNLNFFTSVVDHKNHNILTL